MNYEGKVEIDSVFDYSFLISSLEKISIEKGIEYGTIFVDREKKYSS